MRKLVVLTAILVAVPTATAMAQGLEKGDTEIGVSLSFINVNRGGSSNESARLAVEYGRMLTDRHEIGGVLIYTKQNEFDAPRFGAFYHYNFSARGNLTPFLGGQVTYIGGDLGNTYDFALGAFAGVKVYPFEHAGFQTGLRYDRIEGDGPSPDATELALFGSLRIKF